MKSTVPVYTPGIILFILSLLIGVLCFKDYGMSWDEPIQRGIGVISYNYVFKGDSTLKNHQDRDLGTGFELPLVFLEKGAKLTDSRHIFLMRHLVTHVFFLVAVFIGYTLIYRLFKSQSIACLGFILLAFNPRIYAHSYFNSKDIPFLSAILITFAICQLAFQKNKTWWYVLLGLACGYATSIRSMGILLFLFICLFFIIDIISAISKKQVVRNTVINLFLFIASFCCILYIAWPILWYGPIWYFKEEFLTFAHIWWGGKLTFNGTEYSGRNLPWIYVPEWIAITIPILWLAAGITGIVWVTVSFIKRPVNYLLNTPQRNFLLYLMFFLIPILAVIVLHSVNYDDWRHLYFIYPSFALLALFALHKIMQGKRRLLVQALCVVQIVFTTIFMVRSHPFEQVYFNSLVSHKDEYLRKHFDFEYWGCAYKQGLDYILAHDTSSSVRVFWSLDPVENNVEMLPAEERKRIKLVDRNETPYYYITNFRNHPQDYHEYPNTFYQVKVLNSTVMRVYKVDK
ncbi:MAG TPA: phospholipid carrier-dependent glycosyltransferase [Flavipsychrobacter sp.]|nr:phospholipid carrier-dependent glycosyltransferase [Flavipsychrobacter sp.]